MFKVSLETPERNGLVWYRKTFSQACPCKHTSFVPRGNSTVVSTLFKLGTWNNRRMFVWQEAEAYLQPSQTSKMNLLMKIVNSFQPLIFSH